MHTKNHQNIFWKSEIMEKKGLIDQISEEIALTRGHGGPVSLHWHAHI